MTSPLSSCPLSFLWDLAQSFCPSLCGAVLPLCLPRLCSKLTRGSGFGSQTSPPLLPPHRPCSVNHFRFWTKTPGSSFTSSHTPYPIREQNLLVQLSEYAEVGPLSPPPWLPTCPDPHQLSPGSLHLLPDSPPALPLPLWTMDPNMETRWTLLKEKSDGVTLHSGLSRGFQSYLEGRLQSLG